MRTTSPSKEMLKLSVELGKWIQEGLNYDIRRMFFHRRKKGKKYQLTSSPFVKKIYKLQSKNDDLTEMEK